MTVITTRSAEETMSIGRRLADALPAGGVLSLHGTLGAGKTTLVKGMALALGVQDPVTSPTFTIVSSYFGDLELHHVDLYRLEGLEEVEDLGLEELMGRGRLTVIEWGERAEGLLPAETRHVTIRVSSSSEREIVLQGIEL